MPASDTIVALSTPAGESAVALLRLSGPACPALARAVTGRSKGLRPRVATFSKYLDVNGKRVDDGVFTAFEEGASFTGEAMLEISPHGNPLIVQQILEDLLARGCRPAEPGEFTRTALLNGKMDLSQAEAVADLIRARSERSIEVAQRQLHGSVGRKMSELTERVLAVMAQVEAYIDFPEEDLPDEDQEGPARELRRLSEELSALIETQHYNALLHEGIKTLIVGRPNVGKSSLINALTGSQRAIVSELPGTTRDFISSNLMLGPWRIEILDTAGLHEADDEIERLGMAHTIEQAETADFFLLVLDAASPSPTLPDSLLFRMNPANTLVLENKIDLPGATTHESFLSDFKHCRLSLKSQDGLREFREAWLRAIETRLVRSAGVDGVIVNARHARALTDASEAMKRAQAKIRAGDFSELAAADLRDAVDAIGQVVGKIDNERMLDSLFAQFCIGK